MEIVLDYDEENDCIIDSFTDVLLKGEPFDATFCSINESSVHLQFDDGSVTDIPLELIRILQFEADEPDYFTPCEYSALLERVK